MSIPLSILKDNNYNSEKDNGVHMFDVTQLVSANLTIWDGPGRLMAWGALTHHYNGWGGSFAAVSERHVRFSGCLQSGCSAIVVVGRNGGRLSAVCADGSLWLTTEVHCDVAVKEEEGCLARKEISTERRTNKNIFLNFETSNEKDDNKDSDWETLLIISLCKDVWVWQNNNFCLTK